MKACQYRYVKFVCFITCDYRRIRIDLGLNEHLANGRNLFIKIYRILINTILVYNVKILTMQAAIIKIGKFFLGKVAMSVKTQVSYCFMFKANKYAFYHLLTL